jgi:hypothetical protein
MDLRNQDFVALVKHMRERFDISIEEAHDRILADETLRRLIAMRINSDSECRRQALRDLRDHGDASRFVMTGGPLPFDTGWRADIKRAGDAVITRDYDA